MTTIKYLTAILWRLSLEKKSLAKGPAELVSRSRTKIQESIETQDSCFSEGIRLLDKCRNCVNVLYYANKNASPCPSFSWPEMLQQEGKSSDRWWRKECPDLKYNDFESDDGEQVWYRHFSAQDSSLKDLHSICWSSLQSLWSWTSQTLCFPFGKSIRQCFPASLHLWRCTQAQCYRLSVCGEETPVRQWTWLFHSTTKLWFQCSLAIFYSPRHFLKWRYKYPLSCRSDVLIPSGVFIQQILRTQNSVICHSLKINKWNFKTHFLVI